MSWRKSGGGGVPEGVYSPENKVPLYTLPGRDRYGEAQNSYGRTGNYTYHWDLETVSKLTVNVIRTGIFHIDSPTPADYQLTAEIVEIDDAGTVIDTIANIDGPIGPESGNGVWYEFPLSTPLEIPAGKRIRVNIARHANFTSSDYVHAYLGTVASFPYEGVYTTLTESRLVKPDGGVNKYLLALEIGMDTELDEGVLGKLGVWPLDMQAIASHRDDGTATGGDPRGEAAVDLQIRRGSAAQVASGKYAVLIGGQHNAASGQNSAVLGGANSTASGTSSIVAGGSGLQAGANNAAAFGGYTNKATGYMSTVLGGQFNEATAYYASTAGGQEALAYLEGQHAQARGSFSAAGDAQRSDLVGKVSTSDATTAGLFQPLSGTNDGRATVPSGKVWAFEGRVVAKQTAGTVGAVGDAAAWKLSGAVKRLGNVTTLVGTPTVTQLAVDTNAAAWTVAIVADDTNDSLEIQVTGELDKTIRWVATLDLTEVA